MQLKKATDITHEQSTFLIYANPGVGKTTSLKFIPGKKLVVDIDKSSNVLKGEENIDIIEIDTYSIWKDWFEVTKWISENKDNYDVIIIDNITELFRSVLTQLGREGKNNRVPGMDSYQRADFVLMDSFRYLKAQNKTLIFTSWEITDQWHTEDGQMYNRAMPEIRKSITNNFMGLCDVVARLVVKTKEDGTTERGFVLQPSKSIYAKNRLSDMKGCKVEDLFKVTVGGE